MPTGVSFLEELRAQYEAARKSPHEHADVPGFQEIDAQMRKSFRWLEKAIAYLDGLKPPIEHRFDLGHGLLFESPRLSHAFVGQHEQRIVGYPVLDEINISYEIATAGPLTIEAAPGNAAEAQKTLDDVGLPYTARRVENDAGDRFDRVSLEFHSRAIDEPALEDFVRLVLGRSSAFLQRAPLVGIHGRQSV